MWCWLEDKHVFPVTGCHRSIVPGSSRIVIYIPYARKIALLCFLIAAMVVTMSSWSRITLSRISLSWPSICVLRTFFRTFFRLFDDMIVVVFPDVLSCFLFHGLAYYFYVLFSVLIIAVSRHVSSFLHQSLCWWCYPRFMWLVNCLSYTWRTLLDHVCDCFAHGVGVVSFLVSRIGFSIQVGIRSSLILFAWHLLLVASWSYIFSFPPPRPIWYCPVWGYFQCWLGWWLLHLWRCLAFLLGCSQCRSSLRRLGFSMSISSLLSSGKWY